MQNKLLVIGGPTASGKTALAVHLAKRLNGEIVGADSMQVYLGMDIGTAKPSELEKEGIPHYLIDVVPPNQSFSVADYSAHANQAIASILARGKLPILVGGTGLYIQSVIENIQYPPKMENMEYCQELYTMAQKEGNTSVWDLLNSVDPECAQQLHPNNMGRIVRALEVYHTTGKTMTDWQKQSKLQPSMYDALQIGLTAANREFLYERINQRVYNMLEDGLMEELQGLVASGFGQTAAQAIGYKEFFGYLNKENSLEESVERVQRDSRRYAKRQLTWMRRNHQIHWFEIDRLPKEELYERIEQSVTIWLEEA